MSQQPPAPRIPTHGAVDLSALKARATPPSAGPASGAPAAAAQSGSALGVSAQHEGGRAPADGANPYVVEVTEENFAAEVMATSMQVPVVIDFWAGWCQPCKQLAPIMEKLAAEYDGRFVLATVDTDANQRLASDIGVQSLPTVMAVVGQQPVPLFTGALPEAQVRQFIEELLRVAAANGISGRVAPRDGAQAPVDEEAQPPAPDPYATAHDALLRGDLDAAEQEYTAALDARPGDAVATGGLARVALLRRIAGVDPDRALKAAASAPSDVAAQCLAADVEVASGTPEGAFARLVELVRMTGGDDRDSAREHLLTLFGAVGSDDSRVTTARRALAGALF